MHAARSAIGSLNQYALPRAGRQSAASILDPGACRFWKGLLAVWVGGAIGQALSFLLARYLVKDAVTYYVARKWKKWDLVELVLVRPRPKHTAPRP